MAPQGNRMWTLRLRHAAFSLHWCLDIAFREDHCRVRKDHAPENLAILRHLATNMLKRETSLKGGMQTKRLQAAWDHGYLLKVLTT